MERRKRKKKGREGVADGEKQGVVGERGGSVEIEFRSNTATAGEREGRVERWRRESERENENERRQMEEEEVAEKRKKRETEE